MNYRPTTATQKIIRCISLMNKTTCEKRKKRIFMIKENIIAKENARLEKYYAHPKVQAMYKQRDDINKKFLNIK
jgi:hypothetical protein